uniref:NADH-ubiquinone oxidoreductase chain 4L n=1 Tax=Megaustenia imperator imperator TaxID=2979634 RepID=A0A977PIY1_9EUPU|nr:NADH dehydrogenase subunit 4L [Megaustenia imperator imperator]
MITTVNLLLILVLMLFQSFLMNKHHIIMLLLILESMMLILLSYLFFLLVDVNLNPYMFLLMMTLGTCEAGLGLSVLVSLMRFHGNDYISSISSSKWFAKIKYIKGSYSFT